MDGHFCDSYPIAFSDSDGNPNAERDWNSDRNRLSLSHRQSNPVGNTYIYTGSEPYPYRYRYADTDVAHRQPLAKTG